MTKMSDLSYIYTLSDPDTNQVMYVGKADNPKKRYWQHLYNTPRGKTKSGKWIRTLLDQGKKPLFSIIDECLTDKVMQIESEWIAICLMLNPKLVNTRKAEVYVRYPKAIKFLADNLPHDYKCRLCNRIVDAENMIVTCISQKDTYWNCLECEQKRHKPTRDDWWD